MASKKYTEAEFITAVLEEDSIRQVLMRLGLAPQGGNYKTVHKLVESLGLDTSHWLGQKSNRHRPKPRKRDIADYLSNQYPIGSHSLRLRLLAEGFFAHKCCSCGLTEWLGKAIALELEHVDGCNANNKLDNLKMLCPNCHAQTDTYRGKNIGKAL